MRLFSLAMLMLLSFSAFGQIEQIINFHGQNGEVIKVDKAINIVRPVPYQVPDTCYNQIPYQNYECHNETRYRQQCTYVPARENCWTENDRVCRNVTRTRQECHTTPSRQVCHNVPSREVCHDRPTRRVCRTDANGREHCTDVGGGRSCTQVGGGRECDTVPGERECRNVSYTDQECDNVPRRRCETIPGHNECTDVPYYEEVCGYETRYRQEPYACERTEYRDETTPKKLVGQIDVRFITNGLVEEFPLNVKVGAPNAKFESFAASATLGKEPKVLVVLKKKVVKAEESEKEIVLNGEIVLEVVEAQMISPAFPVSLKAPKFDEAKSLLTMAIEGGISAMGSVDLLFQADPKIGRTKTIAEIKKEAYPGKVVAIEGSNLVINLAGKMQNDLAKKNLLSVKLTAPLSIQGELLNATKPDLEKSYKLELRK